MKGNISVKLLYLAVVPILIISTLLGAYFVSTRIQDVNSALMDKGNLIASSLSPAVEFGLFSHNTKLLKSLTEPLLSDVDVVSILILDKNRSTVVASISTKHPSSQLLAHEADSSVFESAVYSTRINIEDYLANNLNNTLVQNAEADLMGWVVVKLSHLSLDTRQNEILINAILLILSGVFISGIVAYGMAKKIACPLLKLSYVVHEISEGNFDARAETDGVSEIYRLQTGVNVMAKLIGRSQKELKNDIRTATHQLTETVEALEERNARLNATQVELVQANAAKSEFLAKMSHEIRTPLTAVMGFSRLIEKAKNKLDIQAHTRIINQSGVQLLNIIDDILNFSKLENDKQDIVSEEFEVRLVVEDVLNVLSPLAKVKKIALILNVSNEIPVFLKGDPAKLSQILINLLNNAIKFTENGNVCVNVLLVEAMAEQIQVIFEVSDTGIGLPLDVRESIFDSFAQVESDKNRSFEGAGLGLAICKKLVELMNGEIGVKPNDDVGSKFWFRIPLILSDKCLKSSLHIVKNRHVVLYDNLGVSNQALSKTLISWHMDLYVCDKLSELKEILSNKEIVLDYVVLSLDFSESNPSEVALLLDSVRGAYQGKIIILNSFALEETRQLIDENSQVMVIEKPVPRQRLRYAFDKSVDFSRHLLALDDGSFSGDDETKNGLNAQYFNNTAPKERCILLAEDNRFNSMLVRELLADRFIECECVEDAKSVLELLPNDKYDMLLLDVHMPEMDGLTLAQNIRKNNHIDKSIPIIAFTADVYVRKNDELKKKGIDDVLYKPFTDDSLDKMLSLWMPCYQADNKESEEGEIKPAVYLNQRLVDDVLVHLDNIEQSFRSDNEVAMKLHIHQLQGVLGHFQQKEMLAQLNSLKMMATLREHEKFYTAISKLVKSVQNRKIESA